MSDSFGAVSDNTRLHRAAVCVFGARGIMAGFQVRFSALPSLMLAVVLLLSSWRCADGQQAEEVTVTGQLVDLYCWDTLNGVALDTGEDLKRYPTRHTVHCLVEVGVCKNSGFAIVNKAEGSELYTVSYLLDEPGNARAIELMEETPSRTRNQPTGFEITVTGMAKAGSNILETDVASMMAGAPDESPGDIRPAKTPRPAPRPPPSAELQRE